MDRRDEVTKKEGSIQDTIADLVNVAVSVRVELIDHGLARERVECDYKLPRRGVVLYRSMLKTHLESTKCSPQVKG